jgi:hypothetical protein
MEQQEHVTRTPQVMPNGAELLQHAVEQAQTGAGKAVAGTGKWVRRNPVASAGLALGAGIAIGVAARHFLAPEPPKSMFKRLGVAAARGFTRSF